MRALLLILFAAWGVYSLLPYLCTRIIPWFGGRLGYPKVKSGESAALRPARIARSLPHGRRAVALTFDDGPDPTYTPMLLDLLADLRIRATFFIVGERAASHPELIRRMAAEGHEIGVHNYRHWSNWLLPPWSASRHMNHTASIIYELTGQWPTCYRPPWGLLNLFDLFRSRVRYVLWSVMVNDWRAKADKVEAMYRGLSQQVSDGSIILLHDCGDTFGALRDAPGYMLQALARWLRESRNSWQFVTVSEGLASTAMACDSEKPAATGKRTDQPGTNAPSHRRLLAWLASIWLAWDSFVLRLLRIHPVDPQQPFLKVRIRPYTGKQVLRLDDGTLVRNGDRIAEIHLNNHMIYAIGQAHPSIMQTMVALLRRFQPALPQLAAYLRQHPSGEQVKAVYGVSLLHQPAERFGFTVLALENRLFSRISSWYLRLVLRLLQPGSAHRRRRADDRLETGNPRRQRHAAERLEPKIMAISTSKLYRMYPDDTPDAS